MRRPRRSLARPDPLMRWLLPALAFPLGLLLQLVPSPAARAAEGAGELPRLTLERGFLLDGGQAAGWPGEGELAPGITLGLIVDWGEAERPDEPGLAPTVTNAAGPPPLRIRRLVPRDPRADGRDVIEVLVTSLGPLELPSLTLVDQSGTPVARTAPLQLGEAEAVEDPGAIPAPPRPAASIPPDVWGLLLVAGALLALFLGALWARRRWRRRRRPGPREPEEAPTRPPEVVALDALESLLGEGLLERNLIKPFTVRLAEIGKSYFGSLAGVGLLEHTTDECVPLLTRAGLPDSRIEWFRGWLGSLDMIKFAGDRPAAEQLADRAEALRRAVIELSRSEGSREEATG